MFAFCKNPECKAIWQSPGFNIGTDTWATMIGCEVGKCPKCGGRGVIPDGLHSGNVSILTNPHQTQEFINALRSLQKIAQEANNDIDAIEKQVEATNDEYVSHAWRFFKSLKAKVWDKAIDKGADKCIEWAVVAFSSWTLSGGCSSIPGPSQIFQPHIQTQTQQTPQTSSKEGDSTSSPVPTPHLQTERKHTPEHETQ